jgi:hypothetical protein
LQSSFESGPKAETAAFFPQSSRVPKAQARLTMRLFRALSFLFESGGTALQVIAHFLVQLRIQPPWIECVSQP